ncbi:MAG: Gfo/Idh/MocA family oxidoreductase [Polyangiales bacterium]
MNQPLRIGILGAARIAPFALVKPAREVPDVELLAIAARDPERAREFADEHGVPLVFPSYQALIDDPDIDAIYNPLPNSLHAEWTIRSLEAGKHVLCEKPLTSNAQEAQLVADVARRSGRVCMEAFHWRYHPLARRMLEVIASGELGTVRRIETFMCVPLPLPNDIRFDLSLSGGAMMDTGCYAVSMMRHLAGAEPRVVNAQALLIREGVDRRMEAEVAFEDGRTGHLTCSLLSSTLLRVEAKVIGDRGTMTAFNPAAPQILSWLTVESDGKKRREKVERTATYTHQLRAFVDAVLLGTSFPTTPEDAVKNMQVIDDVYRAAGMSPRGT